MNDSPRLIPPGPDAAASIYWLGADAAIFDAQRPAFEARGYELSRCADLASLRALMLDKNAPAPDFLIADLAACSQGPRGIWEAVRRQRRGRHLPIMLLWDGKEAGPEVLAATSRRLVDSIPRSMARELLMMRMRSFLATIRQFQLHPSPQSSSLMTSRDRRIALDLKNGVCRVFHGLEARDMPLSRAEAAILAAMLKKPNQAVVSKDFASQGWTPRARSPKSQALAQHIVRLRRKLGDLGERIETIPRRGYRLREPLA